MREARFGGVAHALEQRSILIRRPVGTEVRQQEEIVVR
jgi:hypothetical protein